MSNIFCLDILRHFRQKIWRSTQGAPSVPQHSDIKEPSSEIQASIPIRNGPIVPSEVIAPDYRLWAIVIGINRYSNKQRLNGAVADANAITQYLETSLKVPKDHIVNLRDQDATRSNIISAFEALRDDDRIEREDPILIYYAGHGGQVSRNDDEDIIQALIPVDYAPGEVYPIPDRTVASLINGIANKHGNNITVILDCCHSGSGTRGDEADDLHSNVRGCELSPNDIPDDLDADILKADPTPEPVEFPGARGLHTAKGFAVQGMKSHVLLAACSANEVALEGTQVRHALDGRPTLKGQEALTVRGRFTVALLDLFENVYLNQITYAEVLTKIQPIVGQNPQCEGFYSNRILFDAKISEPTYKAFEVRFEDRYILQAGKAHGITDGAEFTLYEDKTQVTPLGNALGVMKAQDGNIRNFTTILVPVDKDKVPGAFVNPAIAVQTKAGASEELLIHVDVDNMYEQAIIELAEHELSGAGPNPCRIQLVEEDKEKLKIANNGENLTFIALDQRARGYKFTPMPEDANVKNLQSILRRAAHYHFHLDLNHRNEIENQIPFEFFPLKEGNNEDGDNVLIQGGDNLHKGGKIEYEVDEGTTYGMRITNNTPSDLYFCCLFFDHADFSITALTEVNDPTPRHKDANLKQGQTVKIGYDDSSIPPFESVIREGLDLTIGFLKFIFTSDVTNLSHIPQISPSNSYRGLRLAPKRCNLKGSVWGTVLIPIIQRRRKSKLGRPTRDLDGAWKLCKGKTCFSFQTCVSNMPCI